jgi:hypothetical protein
MNNTVSAQDSEHYLDKGYLVIENALSREVVKDISVPYLRPES